jgi:hypothetical protein
MLTGAQLRLTREFGMSPSDPRDCRLDSVSGKWRLSLSQPDSAKLLRSPLDSTRDLRMRSRVILADLAVLIYGYVSHIQINELKIFNEELHNVYS